MEKESLEKIQEKVVEVLNNSDIKTIDKLELLINLMHFLNSDNYRKNIKILQKQKEQE